MNNNTIYLKDILNKEYCETEHEHDFVQWMYDNLIDKTSKYADELKTTLEGVKPC